MHVYVFLFFVPLDLAAKLNFDISKVAYLNLACMKEQLLGQSHSLIITK